MASTKGNPPSSSGGRHGSMQEADDLVTSALRILKTSPEIYGEGNIGFLPRGLIQISLPYTQPKNDDGSVATHFVRSSKNVQLTLSASSLKYGLPYGSYARLILARLTTQAVYTGNPVVDLGESINDLIKTLGKAAGGGKRGPNAYFLNALHALGSASIYFEWKGKEERNGTKGVHTEQRLFPILSRVSLWTDNVSTDAVVELSPYMLSEMTGAVPFWFPKLIELSKSPMRMDIYVWSTYRASFMRGTRPLPISWAALKNQFGPDYSRLRDFKKAFVANLEEVRKLYTGLRVEPYDGGILMYPSPPDVERRTMMRIDAKAKEIASGSKLGVPHEASSVSPDTNVLKPETAVWVPESAKKVPAENNAPQKPASAKKKTSARKTKSTGKDEK